MKSTKGHPRNSSEPLYYTFKGQVWVVMGETTFNEKKNRIEYIHRGVRGGKYLFYWPIESGDSLKNTTK